MVRQTRASGMRWMAPAALLATTTPHAAMAEGTIDPLLHGIATVLALGDETGGSSSDFVAWGSFAVTRTDSLIVGSDRVDATAFVSATIEPSRAHIVMDESVDADVAQSTETPHLARATTSTSFQLEVDEPTEFRLLGTLHVDSPPGHVRISIRDQGTDEYVVRMLFDEPVDDQDVDLTGYLEPGVYTMRLAATASVTHETPERSSITGVDVIFEYVLPNTPVRTLSWGGIKRIHQGHAVGSPDTR